MPVIFKKISALIFIIPVIILYSIILIIECSDSTSVIDSTEFEADTSQQVINVYGLEVDGLDENHFSVGRNETLTDILTPHNISFRQINEIVGRSKGIFDFTKIKYGDDYVIYSKIDTTETVAYFVYEIDPINYVTIDLHDSLTIFTGKKEITIKERRITGIINNSLYMTLKQESVSDLLALKLAEVFAWQIDFYRIQKGDFFKVIFEEQFIGNKFAGIGKIVSAQFNHRGNDFYAFHFEQENNSEYFDENGKSLRKAFLQAPLKFGRLSSAYSKKRFHPVLKTYRAHLGTDYAAPTGTPILSVGDGIVIEARYSGNNGNYVKIRHNSFYTTQYLHMSKFAKGIKAGVSVKQGQIIGYVGSTGLATGPHVCFRFWKNGTQVDHRREKFPSSHPVDQANMEQYLTMMNHLKMLIDAMPLKDQVKQHSNLAK